MFKLVLTVISKGFRGEDFCDYPLGLISSEYQQHKVSVFVKGVKQRSSEHPVLDF